MVLSRGFSSSEEKGDQIVEQPCIPVTPSKPTPSRPHPISGGNQPETTNSVQNVVFQDGFCQVNPTSRGSSACLDSISSVDQNGGVDLHCWEEPVAYKSSSDDHVQNSFTETPRTMTAQWTAIPAAKLLELAEAASGSPGLSCSLTDREINEAASRNFLASSYFLMNRNLQQQKESASMLLLNQNPCASQNMSQLPNYGFPTSHHSDYGFSPSLYCGSIPVQSEPVTPDRPACARGNASEIANSWLNDQQTQESIANTETSANVHSSYQSQPPVESLSHVLSTPGGETQDVDKPMEGIDLNGSPTQQKQQKRRKHRPKVITEGKPKRTPKPKTPKQATEKPSGKRKYVRKAAKATAGTTTDSVVDPTWEPASKSCRRALDFDLEVQARDFDLEVKARDENHETVYVHQNGLQSCSVQNSSPTLGFNLNSELQAQDSCTVVENSRVAFDLNQCSPQMLEMLDDCTVQSSRNFTEKSGAAQHGEAQKARRSKREYHHMVDETHHHPAKKLLGAHFSTHVCEEILQGNEYRGYYFPQIHKRKRTEKVQTVKFDSSWSKARENRLRQITARRQSDLNSNASQMRNVHFAHQLNHTSGATIPNTFIGNLYHHSMHVGHIGAEMPSYTEALSRTDKQQPPYLKVSSKTTGMEFGSTTGITKRKRTIRVRNLVSKIESKARHKQVSDVYSGTHANLEALSIDNYANMTKKKRTRRGPRSVNSASYSFTSKANPYGQVVLYDYRRGPRGPRGPRVNKRLSPIDEISLKLQYLNINRESNSIVVQQQNAMVLFEPIKKKKPRAKVDLDPESDRVWKLLMGKESGPSVDGTEADKEKWWEEERKVFRGRADSFIARMHLVQGDRRFTRWKGSVVDSVIGVFLTQNVSDNLSSSAFMSLAARFPLQSTSNQRTNCEEGTNILVEEPEVCNLDSDDPEQWHGSLSADPVFDQSSITIQEAEHVDGKEEVDDSIGSNMGSSNSSNDSKGQQLVVNESEVDPTTKGTGKQCLGERENIRATEEIVSSESSMYSAFLLTAERKCLVETAERRAPDDVVSPQNSVLSSQTSDSCVFQTAERIGSCYDSNSEAEDMITVCKSNSLACPTTFTELLHRASMPGKMTMPESYNQDCRSLSLKENSNSGNTRSERNGPDKSKPSLDGIEALTDSYQKATAAETTYVKGTGSSKQRSPSIERPREIPADKPSTAQAPPSCTSPNEHSEQQLHSSGQVANLEMHLHCCKNFQVDRTMHSQPESPPLVESANLVEVSVQMTTSRMQHASTSLPDFPGASLDVEETTSSMASQKFMENRLTELNLKEQVSSSNKAFTETTVITSTSAGTLKSKGKLAKEKKPVFDWDTLRKEACLSGPQRQKTRNTMDTLDYEAVRCAEVGEIADAIRERGMNNMLAERIKDFLNRINRDHGSIDLEWLRDVPPDQAKDYLLSIRGLGLKSVECVRLLTLHHLAFPVDTNVGRIAVRLGWVPLQPLPESLQLHLLELYPMLESIQKYLWPRLCKLDQRTLYELHYQMITFGKVFCTKNKPNCNACPMRAECRHFASAFASARLALPGPEEKNLVPANNPIADDPQPAVGIKHAILGLPAANPPSELPIDTRPETNQCEQFRSVTNQCEPIIEVPASPENRIEVTESDIEDSFLNEDPDEIPSIDLNIEEFSLNLQNYMQENNIELQGDNLSKALVALTPAAASIPMPKLKNVNRLRTEHLVYELPDSHPLLEGMDRREPDDPSCYLLAIWTPGETADSINPPVSCCTLEGSGSLCNKETCFTCNSKREANSQIVRGTILIPCRTAMRGSFPLNGTYFQVNEVFADHDSSRCPINVPRTLIWDLPRRTVFFGTSVISIFKGLSTEAIQSAFWKGFICVRGFDQKTRAPRPLQKRFHIAASKLVKGGIRPTEEQ